MQHDKSRRNLLKSAVAAGVGAGFLGSVDASRATRKLMIGGDVVVPGRRGILPGSYEYEVWVNCDAADVSMDKTESPDGVDSVYQGSDRYAVLQGETSKNCGNIFGPCNDIFRIPRDSVIKKIKGPIQIRTKNNADNTEEALIELRSDNNADNGNAIYHFKSTNVLMNGGPNDLENGGWFPQDQINGSAAKGRVGPAFDTYRIEGQIKKAAGESGLVMERLD